MSILIHGCLFAQTLSYPLPLEAEEFEALGTFKTHLFFSSERPNERSDQLWQFDIETEQFIERTTDTTFLLDFKVTPQGVFWVVKERMNPFVAGKVELWFWSGDSTEVPELLAGTTADKARLIAHSDNHFFLHFDISFHTVDLNTRAVKNLGTAPTPPQNYEGLIWQGRYFWSVSNGNEDHRVYWADLLSVRMYLLSHRRRKVVFMQVADTLEMHRLEIRPSGQDLLMLTWPASMSMDKKIGSKP